MKGFGERRSRNTFLLMLAIVVLLAADVVGSATLFRTAFLSGWLLIALVILLASYNVRKKFPALPLGNSSTWLQLHIYVGILSGVLFCIHLQWRIPFGIFERCFAFLFVAIFFSGVFGLLISRVYARRLGTRGGEVLFRRIPRLRCELQSQVERIVYVAMEQGNSDAAAVYYDDRLRDFFDGPKNFWSHLRLSDRPLKRLLNELKWQNRYTSDTDQETLKKIADRVRRKDDLDFQFAHQTVLKYWLFVHVPLTYALLAFSAFHIILVQAFAGQFNP